MLTEHDDQNRIRLYSIVVAVVFCVLVLGFVTFMSYRSSASQEAYLLETVEGQLRAITAAAQKSVDVDRFISYNTPEDIEADREGYDQTLARLENIARRMDVRYIYALKMVEGKAVFIFDTDMISPAPPFLEYPLSPVHEEAFAGHEAADVLNVQDDYGVFSSAAFPLWKDGAVVGIISVDIESEHYAASLATSTRNRVVLVTVLTVIMGFLVMVINMLLQSVHAMQASLLHMAHYDPVTGLPNRQLFAKETAALEAAKFALFYIDLDNFKQVNDRAGHDAGDAVLRETGEYLRDAAEKYTEIAGSRNLVARIGGDEFILILLGINDKASAEAFAQSLLDGFVVDKSNIQKYGLGLSMGIALYPSHASTVRELVNCADEAMYLAKEGGKNRYKLYEK